MTKRQPAKNDDPIDYVPRSQYKAAERDFEYIFRLIDLALAYFSDGMETSGQVQWWISKS
jgi:hypothetical protein